MRWCLLLVVLLAGCTDDGEDIEVTTCTYAGQDYMLGDTFPEGDGCNTCSCTEMGVACTIIGCVR